MHDRKLNGFRRGYFSPASSYRENVASARRVPREWPFIKLKHIKLGKPDTQEHYPGKGVGTPATAKSKERVTRAAPPEVKARRPPTETTGTYKSKFKVDRLQIIVVAKNISTCPNCSSVGCLKCVQFHNWFRLLKSYTNYRTF